ncbi:MAG: DUF3105 domain-containing protein [Myxococcota bacterium]|nr:DUF3105 domain-containing protein [Myxococcota bacterium]
MALAIGTGIAAASSSCSAGGGAGAPDAAAGAKRLDAPLYVDASCPVVIESPPLLSGAHVPIGTVVSWSSNPPSSGEHFPIWAAYQAYATPVPRGYYVHDLEHGAVVLLYACGDAGCPDVVAALGAVSNAIPTDPLCSAGAEGVRVRTVISPDPLLDVPVAAAAWGWTYKAQCLDLPSLTQFALDHYGQGPESLCANGTTAF